MYFLKAEIYQLTKFRTPEIAQTAIIELLDASKMISHKIWVTRNPEITTVFQV